MLCGDEEISDKRNLWADFSDQTIEHLNRRQYCRGYGRDNTGSYVQFLRVAQGSLKELETHIIIAKRIGYLEATQEEFLLQKSEQIGKMLRALMRSVQRTT